jgi:hypothetical protein
MSVRWANHCCGICWATKGERSPAEEGWPYMPICRAHVIQCGGVVETNNVVVDFTAARKRLRPAA